MEDLEHGSASGNGTPAATVRRVTAVLDAFLDANGELGVTEVASRLRLAKSVVHRLMTALTESEYLLQSGSSRRYTLGPRAVRLGLAALGQLNIRERALDHLQALAAETGETATLSVMVGDRRVYADQVECSQRVRQTIQIGDSAPLYLGASGKAILAFLPPERRATVVQAAANPTVTRADGAPVDTEALDAELTAIRQRGYATSLSERILGATSAAAPVFDHRGQVVGSISVAGVTIRHGLAELERFGELARVAAGRLSVELGGQQSPGEPADACRAS
jgi:IclR family transcriptional regulator, acetate operon repressor